MKPHPRSGVPDPADALASMFEPSRSTAAAPEPTRQPLPPHYTHGSQAGYHPARPAPTPRYLLALQWILRIEGLYLAGGSILNLVSSRLAGGPTGGSIGVPQLIGVLVGLGIGALCFIGAGSISNRSGGSAWKGAVLTLIVFYLLAGGGVAYWTTVADAQWVRWPPLAMLGALWAGVLLLIFGMYLSWVKGVQAQRAGGPQYGPPAFLLALVVAVPSKVLLVAVPLTLLNAERAKALSVVCEAQLRQYAMALQMYTLANRGLLPDTIEWGPNGTLDDHLLLEKGVISHCPEDGKRVPYVYLLDHARAELQKGRHPAVLSRIQLNQLKDSSKIPILWDAAPGHVGRRNVAFADGHVELLDGAEFARIVDAAIKRVIPLMRGGARSG